jgi:hypothetical protein
MRRCVEKCSMSIKENLANYQIDSWHSAEHRCSAVRNSTVPSPLVGEGNCRTILLPFTVHLAEYFHWLIEQSFDNGESNNASIPCSNP